VAFDKDVDVYAGGSVPLPPYINRPSDEIDAARYQTVFAQSGGAVAAPTAGLHFTAELLRQIPHTFVTLHVGRGTFLPVRSEKITEHRMHSERLSISRLAADKINAARRVVAVGTTTLRVLETAALKTQPPNRQIAPYSGETDLFIYPRCAVNKFSSTAFDVTDARERVCRVRICALRVRRSGSRTLSLLQLRRLHADLVTVAILSEVEGSRGKAVEFFIGVPRLRSE
jgi:protein tyrosine phosphatase (PTP) superfamily phosphohydrolase (DUF442 family)